MLKKRDVRIYTKVRFGLLLGSVFVLPLVLGSIPAANAATAGEIQAQIQTLRGSVQALQAQLASSPAPSSGTVTITKTLRLGSTNAATNGEVSQLQQFLAQDTSIYPEGLVTGYFGPLTQRAVQLWQGTQGVVSYGTPATTGYGVVGPLTRAKISGVARSITSPSAPSPTPSRAPSSAPSAPAGGQQTGNAYIDRVLADKSVAGTDAEQLSLINYAFGTNYKTLDEAKRVLEIPFMFAGREQWVLNLSGNQAKVAASPALQDVTMVGLDDKNAWLLFLGGLQQQLIYGGTAKAREILAERQKLVPAWVPEVVTKLRGEGIPFSVELLASPEINLTDPTQPLFPENSSPLSLFSLGVLQQGERNFLRTFSAPELLKQIWPMYYAYYHRNPGESVFDSWRRLGLEAKYGPPPSSLTIGGGALTSDWTQQLLEHGYSLPTGPGAIQLGVRRTDAYKSWQAAGYPGSATTATTGTTGGTTATAGTTGTTATTGTTGTTATQHQISPTPTPTPTAVLPLPPTTYTTAPCNGREKTKAFPWDGKCWGPNEPLGSATTGGRCISFGGWLNKHGVSTKALKQTWCSTKSGPQQPCGICPVSTLYTTP
ncbi:MAG: peptidoglycan-binding domain-containing protein [Candidatus Colwellbacteria bacterium]|nr:peptidoglycan-binding domain-containing protein [Candidatus Colwellbacteria bacterium]